MQSVYQIGLRYLVPAVLALALLLTMVTVSWDDQVSVEAQLATFFPHDCAGGWENPHYASGQPDVSGAGYTPDNSAVFLDNMAEITCTGFAGQLPPLTYQTEAFVRFSWSQPGRVPVLLEDMVLPDESTETTNIVTDEMVTADVENMETDGGGGTTDTVSDSEVNTLSTTTPTTETVIESTGEESVPASEVATEELPAVPVEPAEATATPPSTVLPEPEAELAPVPVIEVEPEPEPETSEPVSWFDWLLPYAFAEVLPLTESLSEVSPTTAVPEPVIETSTSETAVFDTSTTTPAVSTTTASTTATTTDPAYEIPTPTATAETPQFAVSYQIGAGEWVVLGEIVSIHNDIRLPIPKEVVASINDFSDVKLRLSALPQFDTVPPVYLDAVWIEVDYAPLDALGVHSVSSLVPVTYDIADIIVPVSTTSSSTLLDADVVVLSTSSDLMPRSVADFATSIQWIQGIDNRTVLATVVEQGRSELWYFDLAALTVTRIGFADGVPGSIAPTAKDGLVFWLNASSTKIYTYDTRTAGQLYEYLLAANRAEATEYVFTFPYTAWELVWRGSQFLVSHADRGEVFGDSDGRSFEAFVRLFTLTALLPIEGLEALSITTPIPMIDGELVAE